MSATPLFSIVIPTLNEEKYLPKLLNDLAAQSIHDFEVIHVDGKSKDRTLVIAAPFASKFPYTLIKSKKKHVSHQRNWGGKAAQGQWIIFIDADTRIPPYFLLGLRYQLEKFPETDVFSCMIDSKAYNMQHRPIIDFMNLSFDLRAKIMPVAVGALMGCRRLVLDQVQFNEATPVAEDQEFVMNTTKHGFQFRFFKEPCYIYSMRRYQKGKILPLVRSYIASDLFMVSNGQLIKDLPEYPMKGGDTYEENWDPDHDSRS